MMENVNFIVNLFEEVDLGTAIASQGKSAHNDKGISMNAFLKKVFKQNIVEKYNTTEEYLDHIFKLINKADVIELLNTDLEQFFNRRDNVEDGGCIFKNLVLVCKLSKEDSKYLKNSNSIIINFKVKKINNMSQPYIKRIDFMDLPAKPIPSTSIKKIVKDYFQFSFSTKLEKGNISTNNLFLDVKMLSEVFNERSETDGLKLKNLKKFTLHFNNFNKDKKSKSFSIFYYAFEDKIVEKDKEKDLPFVIEVENENEVFGKNAKVYINDEKDVDLKIAGNVSKKDIKEIDFVGSIEDEQKWYAEKISENKVEIHSLSEEKKECISKIVDLSSKIESLKSEKLTFEEEYKNWKEEKQKFEVFNKTLKELESLEKAEANKKKPNEDQLQKIKTNKKSVKEEMSKFDIAKINNLIETCTQKINSKNETINAEEKEMYKFEAMKKELLNKIDNLEGECKQWERRVAELDQIIVQIEGKRYFLFWIDSEPREGKQIKFSAFEYDNLVNNNWVASSFDNGLAKKYKRYMNAIFNFSKGEYKNPYLALALEDPNKITSDLVTLKTSVPLNEKQKIAAQIALGSSSISYLQGPPGTGKTQSICAVVDHVVNNDKKNVLISSSTNEAINNAFERLKNLTKNNPNMIFYKVIKKDIEIEDRKTLFDETTMRWHFANALLENLNPSTDKNEIIKLLESNLTKEELDKLFFKNCITELMIYKNKEILNRYKYLVLSEGMLYTSLEEKIEFFVYKCNKELWGKSSNTTIYDSKIKELWNNCDQKDVIDYVSLFKQFKSSDTKGLEIFKNIKEQLLDNYTPSDKDKDFAQIALENELINVIGLTTTASQEINYFGKSKQLFVEYPIYFEIIDEVSKSTTLEIINTMLLANKVLLAGDYRQLPPHAEIESARKGEHGIVREFLEYIESQPIKNEEEKAYFLNQGFVDDLNIPFFKHHALKIEPSENENNSYTALTESYRFSKDIMELVNIAYIDDEQLTLPNDYNEENFKKVCLKFDRDYKEAINIIDTSFLDNEFINEIKSLNPKLYLPSNESFDQNRTISEKNLKKFNAQVNEYNIYAIKKVLKNLLENNKDIKGEDIGVIAMTRSQANLMRSELRKDKELEPFWSGLKIDTVDNFQGRERDIIIVDTVRAKSKLDLNSNQIVRIKRDLDFYKKIERLNVAVSRPRNKLIIVGALENHLIPEVTSLLDTRSGVNTISTFKRWNTIVANKAGVIKLWEVQ